MLLVQRRRRVASLARFGRGLFRAAVKLPGACGATGSGPGTMRSGCKTLLAMARRRSDDPTCQITPLRARLVSSLQAGRSAATPLSCQKQTPCSATARKAAAAKDDSPCRAWLFSVAGDGMVQFQPAPPAAGNPGEADSHTHSPPAGSLSLDLRAIYTV